MGSLRNYLRAWNRLHKASQLKMGIFFRPGLQKGVENDIFWSEIGSGFKEPGGTPPPRILWSIRLQGSGAGFKIMLDDSFRSLFTYIIGQ